MEFKKRKLRITIEGQAYELAFPTVRGLKSFQEKFAKHKKEDGQIELIQEYLENLGLPMSVSDELEPENLTEIVQVLSGQKKI